MVIDELNNIRSMIKEKQYLEERIAELEQQIYGLKPLSTERTGKGGGAGDHLTTLIENRDKLKRTLEEKLERIYILERRVEDAVEILIPEERNIVRLFYLKGLSLEAIACRTNYSERRVREFKTSAVKKIEEKYNSAYFRL